MRKESEDFLFEYLNTYSPTSHELPGQKVWLKYLKPYIDEHFLDPYGTAVGVINPGKEKKVVIEAHADEISWMVKHIDSDGYMRVVRNGGSDHQIAPSMRVWFHTENGKVPGVFGWPAVHVRRGEKEANPSLDNIFLDCGCESKEEVEELGIHVGTVVTFTDGLTKLNDRFYTGRALDNRIGGFIIAEVVRQLKDEGKELPFTLYIVNSVQEEVGLKGATMIAERLKPDVALCIDVNHGTNIPMYNAKKQGDIKCGHGPTLAHGPAIHNLVLKHLHEVANKHDIPFQRQAASRATGTDTDAFQLAGGGIPSALVALPIKYMHTTVESAHKDDIDRCIQLMKGFLADMPSDVDFNYKLDI